MNLFKIASTPRAVVLDCLMPGKRRVTANQKIMTVAKAALNIVLDLLMKPGSRSVGRKPFDSQELKLLLRALRSQNLCCIDGQMVGAFEKEFAQTYGVPYAVASTSGTSAIHAAL